MKKVKLFCIPYAGGSAVVYNQIKKYLDESICFYPIELPGRGKRFKEELISDMNLLVEDIYNQIKDDLDEIPYAFFGYSMGSIIAFELCYKIMERKGISPRHMFFCARESPHINIYKKERMHDLSFDEFKSRILKLGGTNEEIFENKELREIFVPIIKSDYKALDNYEYLEKPEKIECSFSIFNGLKDKYTLEDMKSWSIHTKGKINLYNFDDGHFFINNHGKEIADIVNNTLKDIY